MKVKNIKSFFSMAVGVGGAICSAIGSVMSSAASASEEGYLGGYTRGTNESEARLVLLDDNTFCFQFTGGALDLMAAGTWTLNSNKSGISLKEIRPNADVFPNFSDKKLDKKDLITISFDGYSMSSAVTPVFMISETNSQPKKFRPLFDESQNTWDAEYTLPGIKPSAAKYFFIGFTEVSRYQEPLRVKIFQYKLGDVKSLRIGFNPQATKPLMNMSAVMEGDSLNVDGVNFGTKDVLTKEVFEQVRQNCIYPILSPKKVTKAKNMDDDEADESSEDSTLKPIKEFYVDLNAVSGDSYTFIE